MINPFIGPQALLWKLGALAVFAIACTGFGAYKMYTHEVPKRIKVEAAFSQFKTETRLAGEARDAETARINGLNKKNKEKADAENKRRTAAMRADIERLRNERDSARSSFLSKPPAGSVCPDGQVCLNRAEYLAAYRALVERLRAIGDEGTEVTNDLDTAKVWAKDIK